MKRILTICLITLGIALTMFAQSVTCPYHVYSSCYDTGQQRWIDHAFYEVYHCSCGDNVLVAK